MVIRVPKIFKFFNVSVVCTKGRCQNTFLNFMIKGRKSQTPLKFLNLTSTSLPPGKVTPFKFLKSSESEVFQNAFKVLFTWLHDFHAPRQLCKCPLLLNLNL